MHPSRQVAYQYSVSMQKHNIMCDVFIRFSPYDHVRSLTKSESTLHGRSPISSGATSTIGRSALASSQAQVPGTRSQPLAWRLMIPDRRRANAG